MSYEDASALTQRLARDLGSAEERIRVLEEIALSEAGGWSGTVESQAEELERLRTELAAAKEREYTLNGLNQTLVARIGLEEE